MPDEKDVKSYGFYGWENADITDDRGLTPNILFMKEQKLARRGIV